MTASGQMYLKAVYYLSRQGNRTHVAYIADALEVKRSSASNALKSLVKQGYVVHKPYGDVKLTPQGKQAAMKMIRMDQRIQEYCYCN